MTVDKAAIRDVRKPSKVFWPCADCGTECFTGVSGMIGRGRNQKHYCLKHYDKRMKDKKAKKEVKRIWKSYEVIGRLKLKC